MIFSHVKRKPTAKAVWDELKKSYEGQSTMVRVDKHWELGSVRCSEEDDMQVHFEQLAGMREELSAMDTQVTEEEYAYILLRSLPKSYVGIVNSLAAQANLNSQTITPSNVIHLAMDKYAHHMMEKKNKGMNKAFAAAPEKAINKRKKRDIECFNCHKCGHIKVDCWASGRGKEGQGP